MQPSSLIPSGLSDHDQSAARDVLDRVERLHAHLAALGAAGSVVEVVHILAAAAKEITGSTCVRVVLPDAAFAIPCDDADCQVCAPEQTGAPLTGADMSWRLREGRLLLGNSRTDDVSNRLVAWLVEQAGLGLDRTRQHATATATVDALLQSERERSELVEVLAHDLRSPMTALHGFASLLAQRWSELDEDRRRDLLAMIQRETGRMNRLVDDVTGAVLGPSTQLPMRLSPIDVGGIASDLVVAAQASSTDHTIRSVVAPGTPRALGDEDRLSQILANLLENVLRHTPAGTLAVVHVGRDGDDVAVTVADDGPGVNEGDRERIFERGERAAVPVSEGTGLGLHSARQLAEAMGGSLTLTDNLSGAGFVLRLPTPGPRAVGGRP